ncbi:MAG: hypothetical protein KDB86_00620, partial [Actinobacteria bacterium]|nr:hypothetical protein [Actinomycetota bacterium]
MSLILVSTLTHTSQISAVLVEASDMVVSEPESPVLLDPAVFELLSEARSACVVVAESSTASS